MRYLYSLAILVSILFWSSCRNDFESVASTGNLEFSKDTVYLDTVFTNIGSSTYNLKVYNRSDDDINIPVVRLEDGEESNYRLNVDGIPGKIFEDVQIMANDSIFIFIETTLDITNYPNPDNSFLYTDKILFDTGGNQQDVDLVTLVKDAVFLYPERFPDGTVETLSLGTNSQGEEILIEGFFLDDNELTFTNEKPYVIYGFAAVGPTKTLTVEPGARIHFHANSGILVANTGSLKSVGLPSSDPELLENEIIFEGDRLEPSFADIPGQWFGLWLTDGSTDHEFNYTTIKNASVGILMDNNDGGTAPTLTLRNTQIYNAANYGLLARTGNVYGENMVINNCGIASLSLSLGGSYEFNHSTFANYWTNGFRTTPTVLIDNVIDVDGEPFSVPLVRADFNNCIIYGNELREIGFVRNENEAFNFNFNHCLIKFEDPNNEFTGEIYNFQNTNFYNEIVRNVDPVFFNTELNDFNIERGASGAENIGQPGITPQFDLNGTNRGTPPDAGAYESVIFPDPGG